jgi:catechol 2,3-dioxygenase-like lactoylglutathione lyase family enzyme
MPIGRFQSRFGRHWHSVAWYCDDIGPVWEQLRSHGVRMHGAGAVGDQAPPDGDIYSHPKDTFTQLEFFQPSVASGGPQGPGPFEDPRFEPGWTDRWRSTPNPLGIERMAYVTIVVPDVAMATKLYREVLGAPLLHRDTSGLTGCTSAYVAVGPETVLELAQPAGPDGLAAGELAAHGGMCHAVAFTVADLDRVAAHLASVGVGLAGRDATTILTDPADSFGAPFRFTTTRVPGDPRD